MKENEVKSLCKSDDDNASYHSYNYSLPQAFLPLHIFNNKVEQGSKIHTESFEHKLNGEYVGEGILINTYNVTKVSLNYRMLIHQI